MMTARADKNSFLHFTLGLVLGAACLNSLAAGTQRSVAIRDGSYNPLAREFTPAPVPTPYDTAQDFGSLTPGEVITRKMVGGEAHSFHVALTEGQFLRVIVEQQGVDIEVKIAGPTNEQNRREVVQQVDSPNGLYGPESVSIIAPLTGDYLIGVRSGDSVPGGGYELKSDGPREPTESDRDRVAAETLFAEGQQLRFRGEPESLRQAVEKYTESLALWEKLGDAHGRAYTTCNIGRTYKGLCDIPDAIANLNRAASILR